MTGRPWVPPEKLDVPPGQKGVEAANPDGLVKRTGGRLLDATAEPDGSLLKAPPADLPVATAARAVNAVGDEVYVVRCPRCSGTHHYGRVAVPAVVYCGPTTSTFTITAPDDELHDRP